MKITNLVFALAYAAASSASTNYASSAPAVPAPQQSFVATRPSPAQPVPVTPIPIVVADFVYSPIAGAAPSVPAPAPPAADYTAKAAPVVSVTVAPANPQPEPIVSMMPLPVPAPTPTSSYRAYTSNKRDVDQSAIEGLVSGTSAMLFNANGNSYILARLPVDLATKAAKNPSVLRKRESESDLIADATTNDLNSSALLYELIGKIFARVTLPVNANVGISNPEDSGELMRRDLLDNILGEVVASAVAPLNIVANINPDEDGNGLVPNLLGRISATIQASPTVTAHIFDADKDESDELLRRDLLENILGEVIASAVAPLNIVADINPDEDGNGLLPNLLGRVSATIQASPTVTAHLFDSDKDDISKLLRRDLLDNILGEVVASAVAPLNIVANINPDEDGNGLDESDELLRRDLLENILGEVVASAVAPLNIVADINPDEDGNGLVPNLLGRISATIQASPTVTAHLFDSDKDGSDELLRRDLLDNILGEVVASAVAPLNIVANINPDEDGNGLVPNLLGRISATIQASPTVTAHIFDADKDESDELLRRDLLENILGEVVASAVAPLNIVADINPDEDGNGLVPNLLGRISATIQASPTVTAHLFDSDKDGSDELLRRDLLENILGEVVASAAAPVNIVANINPDEDGNGLVPNLLGRISATIQVSPTVTAHLFDSDKDDSGKLLKKDVMAGGIYTERVDDAHIAIYVPLTALTKGQSEVSRLVSAAGGESIQIVSMTATPTVQTSSAPTPAATSIANSNIFLRIVVPSSKLM
ncbi:hypothetical protein IW147_006044 [Coemansia sp. RSA 720]|nr:hypothetical protein IW147_006044 [Coemansia sp. RSA 720]